MEANLNILSDDILLLSNYFNDKKKLLPQKNEEEEEIQNITKAIKENLKISNIYSQNYIESDYIFNLHKKNDKEYYVELNCSEEVKNKIKTKINLCLEKEKILTSKKEEFKKLQNNITIDEKLFLKKLYSLIDDYKEESDKIIDQIISNILDYDNFIKETSLLQEKIIKYRSSLILQLCFKIYWHKIYNSILYTLKKYIIILYNEKIFNMTCKIYEKLIKKIVDELYDTILDRISADKVFLKHKSEYQKMIQLYREISYSFFIFYCFDKNQEKIIYNIDKDMNLDLSENDYDIAGRFNYVILKRTGLNCSLDFFKERINFDVFYASYLKEMLLLYQKHKTTLPDFKMCSFLFD